MGILGRGDKLLGTQNGINVSLGDDSVQELGSFKGTLDGKLRNEAHQVDMFKQARQMGSWGQGVNIPTNSNKCFGMIDPSNLRTFPGFYPTWIAFKNTWIDKLNQKNTYKYINNTKALYIGEILSRLNFFFKKIHF